MAARPIVLVVDDEPQVHSVIARMLERVGIDCVVAGDGAAALEQLDRLPHPPALVITNMRMPRMDGPELGRWLRQTHPTLPVLYISGYGEQPPPNSHWLEKPFSQAALLSKVREISGGSLGSEM